MNIRYPIYEGVYRILTFILSIKYSIVFYNSPKDLFPVFIFKNPFIFTGCVILQIK